MQFNNITSLLIIREATFNESKQQSVTICLHDKISLVYYH